MPKPEPQPDLRKIAEILASGMNSWIEMRQTDDGYEIEYIKDRVKELEVYAALRVVWPQIEAVLRASPESEPNHD